MKEDIKKHWFEFKNEIKLMFKEFFKKETNKKQRANMWTFARLVISFFIPLFSLISILIGSRLFISISVILAVFGGATDYFDGNSARKYNSSSEFGSKLDQITDKIFSMMLGINLTLFNPMFLITLLGEILIVFTNLPYKLKYKDLNIKSSQMGRFKQWPLFATLGLGFTSILVPGLTTIINVSILITFLMQLLTSGSYIINNNECIEKLINKNKDIKILDIQESKNNEKVKTLEHKEKNNKTGKLEKYKEIRDLLIEVIEKNNNIFENKDQKGFQKNKK